LQNNWGFLFDKLTFIIISLTIWLFVVVQSLKIKYFKKGRVNNRYEETLVALFFTLFLSFRIKNLLGFYIFFELSLIPLLFIIVGWGYQSERIQAAFYLFIYTVVGSLPLLVFLVFLKENIEWRVRSFKLLEGGGVLSIYLFIFICLRFFIKLPTYGFHLWLPKAHVEAPVAGSIILAAILLKIRMFGFFRFAFLIKSRVLLFSNRLIVWLFWGAFWSSCVSLIQTDIKSLVAYSSIRHMGVIIGGFFRHIRVAVKGTFIIMLAHGFCSSAIFFITNILYEQNQRRQLLLLRGQRRLFIILGCWWFFFLIINFSAPPFISLFGELLIIVQTTFVNFLLVTVVLITSIVVASFCVYVFRVISHGQRIKQNSLLGVVDVRYSVFFFSCYSYNFINFLCKFIMVLNKT